MATTVHLRPLPTTQRLSLSYSLTLPTKPRTTACARQPPPFTRHLEPPSGTAIPPHLARGKAAQGGHDASIVHDATLQAHTRRQEHLLDGHQPGTVGWDPDGAKAEVGEHEIDDVLSVDACVVQHQIPLAFDQHEGDDDLTAPTQRSLE